MHYYQNFDKERSPSSTPPLLGEKKTNNNTTTTTKLNRKKKSAHPGLGIRTGVTKFRGQRSVQ